MDITTRHILFTVLIGVTLALTTACWHDNDGAESAPPLGSLPPAAMKLTPMENCEAYQTYVARSLVERYTPSGWSDGRAWPTNGDVQVEPTSPAPPQANTDFEGSGSAPDHVTGTNNQETGVDEADIVKADSTGTMYVAHGTTLRVVQGHPPTELKELAVLDLGGQVTNLHLDESRARIVALAEVFIAPDVVEPAPANATSMSIAPPYYNYRRMYRAVFIDTADKANPVVTATFEFDGAPLSTRHIGNRIHAVITNTIDLPAALNNDQEFWKVYWSYYNAASAEEADAIAQKIKAAIQAAVAAADITEFLPRVTSTRGDVSTTAPLVDCTGIQTPQVVSYPTLVTVASFDIDAANLAATSITAHAAVVYASTKNLYVTQNSGGWWIEGDYLPQTGIHKFGIDGSAPVYKASGLVDGWIPNSFALSEFNDDLRVVTNSTVWRSNQREVSNDLFILSQNGADDLMKHRGSVRGFGKGEGLFSVRFLGTRGFAVTFLQVDPLFTFDLSNPDDPKLMGELTIPGFSTYMHPLGDSHLLTVGRDGNRQVQLQIFNIADLSKPELVHKTPVAPGQGYSWTDADYDHHAFTFDDTTGTLAIPLSYYNYTTNDSFNGIVAFNVSIANGFKEIVRVDHDDLVPRTAGYYWYSAYPRRSVMMTAGDASTLYSISNVGIKATDLAPPNDTLGRVAFPPPATPYPPCLEVCAEPAVVN